jgi:hypothetical protein
MKQLNKIKAYRVWSDNFDGILMTPEAYRELILSMSTGDHATHRKQVELVDDFNGVITTNDLNDPFFNPEEYLNQSNVEYINNVIHVDFVRKVRI